MISTPSFRDSRRGRWLLCLALIALYLAARLPHLRDLPAFTDETTYARWAQLVREDPAHNLFVSMSDAKPPLHYWLLALTRWLAADPILAGRLLSVLTGVLIFPALIGAGIEFSRLQKRPPSQGLLISAIAAILVITSPLIATQQRTIMAEALLLPQAVAMAWLGLRLARQLAENAPRKSTLLLAAAIGLVWASALLTKQVFSYFLWGFVPLAMLIHARRDSWKRLFRQSILPLILLTLIGVACFIPVLLSNNAVPLKSRLLYKPVFLPHANDNRLTLAWFHVIELFWPQADGHLTLWPHNPHAPLDTGILYLYLTPPILLAVLLAFAWMIRRRAWAPIIFLGGWALVFMAAFALGAGMILPRYTTLLLLPLLLAVAWFLADIAKSLQGRLRPIPAAAALVALSATLIAWPAAATEANVLSWQAPVYTSLDARQYVTEFGGGHGTEETLLWLAEQASDHPITVITGNWVGNPNDAMWLYLSGNPNIQIYWDDCTRTLLHPISPGTYLLGENRWIDKASHHVPLDLSRPTFFIVPIMHFRKTGIMRAAVETGALPPHVILQHFTNPNERFDTMDYEELVLIQLEPGAKLASVHEPAQ